MIGPGSSERLALGRLGNPDARAKAKREPPRTRTRSARRRRRAAKSRKVYSACVAGVQVKPGNVKPAIVTNVPVNIGKAVEV